MNTNRGGAGTQIATIRPQGGPVLPIGELMERIIAAGDVAALAPEDRAHYLVRVAESAGLNPLSQPFDLIPGQGGKLKLYPNKSATDQLRKMYRLRTILRGAREEPKGIYVIEVEVTDGIRTETNIGAVPIAGLQGEALANAMMKAHTKAKRRATLDFVGLGLLDEIEVEVLRSDYTARHAEPDVEPAGTIEARLVDSGTGEITEFDTGDLPPDGPPAAVTDDMMNEEIKRLRLKLGWSDPRDVVRWAAEQDPPLNPAIREDKWEIVNALTDMVNVAFSDADDEAQQGSFIDAESRVAGAPGLDRHSA
jgi:hypothetical protein